MADGKVVVAVDMKDENAIKGIDRLDKQLAQMSGSGEKASGSIKNIVTALGLVTLAGKAIDLIKGSLDNAFSRIDTMEQFRRTMGAITGNTKAAETALEELKTITRGTAYGLDTAAKATQDFVTRGMSIGDATKRVGIWADAVAFYGKGTNEQLLTVSDALAKMETKGTVTMDQLNRLFDAGIDAVGMYAKVVGESSSDVQTDLSKGNISAAQFIDTVSKAMEGGTNGVQKLAGAAKEAGASWQGTFDNMRAAVSRGIVSVLESLDQSLKQANLPQIRDMIAGIGKTFETVLGALADKIPSLLSAIMAPVKSMIRGLKKSFQDGGLKQAAETIKTMFSNIGRVVLKVSKDVLPRLLKAIDFLAGHLQVIVPLVLGMYTAWKTWQKLSAISSVLSTMTKMITGNTIAMIANVAANGKEALANVASTTAITAKHLVVGVLTGKIGLVTAAQYAWNVAMNANPIGLVITALGALAIGLGAFAFSQKAATETVDENAQKLEKSREMIQDMRESWDDLQQAQEQQVNSDMALMDHTQSLWNELRNITDENGKIKKGYEARAAFIVGELSDALETEIGIVDGVVQKYKQLEDSMDDLIIKKRADAILSAKKASYEEALINQEKALIEVGNLAAIREEKANGIKQLANKLTAAAIVNTMTQAGTLEDLSVVQKDVSGTLKELGINLDDYGVSLQDVMQEQSDASTSLATLGIDMSEYAESFDLLGISVEDYGSILEAMADHQDEFGYNLSMVAQQTAQSYETTSKSMFDQSQEIKALDEQLGSSLTQYGLYTEEVVEYETLYADRISGNTEKISSTLNERDKAFKLTTDTSKQELEQQISDTQTLLATLNEGIKQGTLDGNNIRLQERIKGLQADLEEYQKVLPEYTELGKQMGQNTKDGAKQSEPAVQATMLGLLNDPLKQMSQDKVKYNLAGKDVVTEYSKGIDGSKSQVIKSAMGMTQDPLASIKKDTGRFTSAGKDAGEGYSKGIQSGEGTVKKSAQDMTNTAMKGITDTQQSSSPSKKTMEYGKDFASGYETGIQSGIADSVNQAVQMTKKALDAIIKTIGSKPASYGQDFASGFAGGIAQRASAAAVQATNMVKNALLAVKKAQDSNSPARITRLLGRDNAEGYALGIEDGAFRAEHMAKGMAERVVDVLDHMSPTTIDIGFSTDTKEWEQYFKQLREELNVTLETAMETVIPKLSGIDLMARHTPSAVISSHESTVQMKSQTSEITELLKAIATRPNVVQSILDGKLISESVDENAGDALRQLSYMRGEAMV